VLLGGAALAAAAFVAPASAASASSSADASVAPCTFSATGKVAVRTINGRASSGTWRVSDEAECGMPQSALDVRAALLRNGHPLKKFAPGDTCTSGGQVPGCNRVAGAGSRHISKGIAGTWVLRVTMTVRGVDAPRMAQVSGCAFSRSTTTTVCSIDSPPRRIR
jgi:hypothetical protein